MKSLLFVPANKKMINKIPGFTADAYIIDLEDSIPDEKKEEALKNICDFLNNKHESIYVRLDERYITEEINCLKNFEFSGYMIPKFEDPVVYTAFAEEFEKRDVIALIETPKGMTNLQNIMSCDWIDRIAFGAEDYTASIGMANKEKYLIGIKSLLIMYCKACNKPVYDTPSFILDDMDALENEVRLAQDLGFDGKLAINPKHINIINNVFSECDSDYITNIIEQYNASGEAVLKINGKVYEKMHIDHLKKILKERS